MQTERVQRRRAQGTAIQTDALMPQRSLALKKVGLVGLALACGAVAARWSDKSDKSGCAGRQEQVTGGATGAVWGRVLCWLGLDVDRFA